MPDRHFTLFCDFCRKTFTLNETEIHEQTKLIKGVKVYHCFFRCPHCKNIYTIMVEDDEIRAIKKKLEKNPKDLNLKVKLNELYKSFEEWIIENNAEFVTEHNVISDKIVRRFTNEHKSKRKQQQSATTATKSKCKSKSAKSKRKSKR